MTTVSSPIQKRGMHLGAWMFVCASCWTVLIGLFTGWDYSDYYWETLAARQSVHPEGESIPTPEKFSEEEQNAEVSKLLLRFAAIWTVGILGIYFFLRRVKTYISGIERAKDALRESESLHRTLLENLPIGLVVVDPQTRVIESVNSHTASLFGAPREKIVGNRCHKFLCPAEEGACPICDLGMEVDHSEKVLLRADGSSIPILKTVHKFHINGEEKLIETFVDISQRKEVEELLRVKSAFLSGLLLSIPDIIFLKDEQGRYLGCNPEFAMLVNRDLPGIIGSTDYDLFAKEVADLFRHHDAITMAAGKPCSNEEWVEYADGRRILLETQKAPLKDIDGRIIGLLGVSRDITERKRTEEALRTSEARLRSITDWAHDAILMMDPQGAITYWNPAAESIFGYGSAEILGQNLHQLLAPERYREAHHAAFPKFLLTGEGAAVGKTVELMARRKDGREIDVALSLSGVLIEGAWHAVGILHDITERKEMERRQDLSAAILQILNEPLDLSESINNILNAIKLKMGFDEVGIRLQNGEDFPYFSQNGFSGNFASDENELAVSRTLCGLGRDANGVLRLECTCGLVLSGRADPANPHFTKYGSFWTNDASALLDLSPESDPRINSRNYCIEEGSRSIALIPLRVNQVIVGLLRLSDRKKDCFTPDLIQYFEGVSASIGVALERKHAEDAIRESEEKFRTHIENAFDVIFTIDSKGTFLFVSPAWERLLGYSVGDAVGKTFAPFVHPEDLENCANFIEQVLNHGHSNISLPYRVKCANGDWRWFEANATRYVNPKGEIEVIGIARDITERRLSEESLRISQTKYKTLYNSSLDAIALYAGGPHWLSGNPAAVALFGCRDLDEFLSHNPVSLSPEYQPDNTPSAVKAKQMREIALREGSHEFEWTFSRMDGSQFLASVSMSVMEFDGQTVTLACIRDITEKKKAVLALEREATRYRTIMNTTLSGIYIMDSMGKLLECNNSFLRILGFTREESQYLTVYDWNAQWDEKELLEILQLQKKHGTTFETLHRRKDGSLIEVEVNATSMMLDGKLLLCNSVHDITDRKRAEHSLRQSEEELKCIVTALESANVALEKSKQLADAAAHAKSQFLANMSHEIRTPMTAILGYADLLIHEPGLEKAPPQRRHNLETIKRNGVHLLELINDILDLSKVEAGKMQIEPVRCSPFELVGEVISLMQVRADEKQLTLATDLSGPLPETVLIDPLRTRQVLVNLVGNAIKFTDEGEIRIVGKLRTDGDRTRLCFEVIDAGIGMNEEQVSRLFQAFSQVDNSAIRKFGGTGLGLCICKRLSEAMGGSIEVHSTPGKGSIFRFTIDPGPLDEIPMIQNGRLPERKPIVTSTTFDNIKLHHRILLAEDGPDNQRLIRMVLEDAGATVTTVENGRLAVDTVLAASQAGEPFAVILMDMQMPVMDGYAATQELRRQGYAAPVIALTAHAMSDDRQKCLDAGCDEFVTKPIDWQKLIASISHWTSRVSGKMPAIQAAANDRPPEEAETVLRSEYADNPIIAKIIPEFVQNLESRLQAMNAELSQSNLEELRRLAHQLKGAGGSYGYPAISKVARMLESNAIDGHKSEAKASFEKLAAVCRAAIRGLDENLTSASAKS